MQSVDDSVLKPGTGIDLVKNLQSLTPVAHASVIFEADRKSKQLIVAAPGPAHALNDKKTKKLHVSTMLSMESGEKNRMGFACHVIKEIPGYRLANGNTTHALLLRYDPAPEAVNVRTAFRYSPSTSHDVLGKLSIAGHEFFSGKHFRICDISTGGVGLVIPLHVNKKKNPLKALEPGHVARLGIVLRDNSGKQEQIATLDTAISVVRVNRRFNERSCFAGCRFTRLDSGGEDILSHFIHKAQLHEIRSITHT